MHVEAVANGLGAQSTLLAWLACERRIPGTVIITSDTGSENDRLWSTGRRSTSQQYFDEVVAPMAEKAGLRACFVRSVNKAKDSYPPLFEHLLNGFVSGKPFSIHVPLFGSNGGRLRQTCTERWKLTAMRQELRRMGAKTARFAIGIHAAEAWRRVKGEPLGMIDGHETYKTGYLSKKKQKWVTSNWLTHYYPLVELNFDRQAVREQLQHLGIPFLVSTECDGCPHKDATRWFQTAPEKIQELAEMEAKFVDHKGNRFFLTDKRVPLLQAIEIMKVEAAGKIGGNDDADFGCKSFVCGI